MMHVCGYLGREHVLLLLLRQVSKVDPSMPQEDAKVHLISRIDTYIQVWPKMHCTSFFNKHYRASSVNPPLPAPLWRCKPALPLSAVPLRCLASACSRVEQCYRLKLHTPGLLPVAQEKIVFADDMLVGNAVAKIDDGDVILTYAYSTVVFDILVKAHQVGLALAKASCAALPGPVRIVHIVRGSLTLLCNTRS